MFVSCLFPVSLLWLVGFSVLVLQFSTNGPSDIHPEKQDPQGVLQLLSQDDGEQEDGGLGGVIVRERQAMLERVERPLYQVVRG